MITVARGDNVRSFIGTSNDTKPTNVDDYKSTGTSYLSSSQTEDYIGPHIGQGSIFFELDTGDIYMYDGSPEAQANSTQWVKVDSELAKITIVG